MKKLFFVLLIGILISTAVFADHEGLGVGIIGGGGFGSHHGYGYAGLSLKVPSLPIFWGIYPAFYGSGFGVGVTGDFYFFDDNLIEQKMTGDDGSYYPFKLDWFLGVGGFVDLHMWKNGLSADLGVRVPIGLSWHIIKQLELFLDIAPGIGVYMGPGGVGLHWAGAAELGLRFWIQ